MKGFLKSSAFWKGKCLFLGIRYGITKDLSEALQWIALGDSVTFICGESRGNLHYRGTVKDQEEANKIDNTGDVLFVKNKRDFYINIPTE